MSTVGLLLSHDDKT